MAIRIVTSTLLALTLSTSAIAQSTGGAGSAGGAAGGASGSAPAGTAGASPSASAPAVGTPGIPGPASGAGLPGGPGPGNTVVAPNQPPAPSAAPAVGEARRSSGSNPVGGSTVNSGRNTAPVNRSEPITARSSTQGPDFHPEAVTDRALAEAVSEIRVMPASELRQLDALFDTCTVTEHPIIRDGKCAAATRQYKSNFGKDRAIDRALAELDRVVRFQQMFRTSGVRFTDHEDNINNRLRSSTALALTATGQSEPVSLKQGEPRH